MGIRDWPAAERPRERLLERGAAALSDAELLAIFLRVGVAGKSAVDLARDLLEHFGGLRELLRADRAQFCSARGLGTAKFVQLAATLEMSRRLAAAEMSRGSALESPDAARRYLTLTLRDRPAEAFVVLFLDNRHRVLVCEELFQGTIDGASVHPRIVVQRALALNAAAVILAHNHPSGVAEPSASDRAITQRLVDALATVDIRVLDHLVVGDDTVSFAERGLL